MPHATRSTYTVIELDPNGGPARSYNAVITPYYAGDAPPGYKPPTEPPPGGTDPDTPIVRWVMGQDGWYFGLGPFQKPRPIHIDLPEGVKYKWVLTEEGYFFAAGPYDKPQPLPPPGGGGETPPPNDDWLKPPPVDGGWGYHNDAGWVFVPGTSTPGPK